MKKYKVIGIELETKRYLDFEIVADEAETTDSIVLTINVNGKQIIASDYNYFPAYQKLRDMILELGYGIKCNGSRINAIQSAIMGSNNKIYLVELFKQAFCKDIVNLYDYADIYVFPNTQDQTAFSQEWISSLEKK